MKTLLDIWIPIIITISIFAFFWVKIYRPSWLAIKKIDKAFKPHPGDDVFGSAPPEEVGSFYEKKLEPEPEVKPEMEPLPEVVGDVGPGVYEERVLVRGILRDITANPDDWVYRQPKGIPGFVTFKAAVKKEVRGGIYNNKLKISVIEYGHSCWSVIWIRPLNIWLSYSNGEQFRNLIEKKSEPFLVAKEIHEKNLRDQAAAMLPSRYPDLYKLGLEEREVKTVKLNCDVDLKAEGL